MIPPTCRAVFIIHAKCSVHNIIVNAVEFFFFFFWEWRMRSNEQAKQLFHRVKQNMKMLKFALNPFIFVHFQFGYLVNITSKLERRLVEAMLEHTVVGDDMEHFCNIVHVQIFAENENWENEIESDSPALAKRTMNSANTQTSLFIFLEMLGFPSAYSFHF